MDTLSLTKEARIDAFKLWCCRRLLRVTWTPRRSNHSFVKEINPEFSLEGLMLKLKFQYFGDLLQRTDSLEKSLMLGKIEGRRRRRWQWMHHWLNGHEFEQAPGDSGGQGSLVCYSPWGHKEADRAGQLNNNTFRHGKMPACSHDVTWHCECHNISWQESHSSGFTWYLGY